MIYSGGLGPRSIGLTSGGAGTEASHTAVRHVYVTDPSIKIPDAEAQASTLVGCTPHITAGKGTVRDSTGRGQVEAHI